MELLQLGLRWRLRNGRLISIGDKWLPQPKSFQLSVAHCTLDNTLKVTNVIGWNSRRWKLEMLRGKVCAEDEAPITSITICLFPKADKLVWHYNDNGVFSVKSGYHVLGRHCVRGELPPCCS